MKPLFLVAKLPKSAASTFPGTLRQDLPVLNSQEVQDPVMSTVSRH